MITGELKNKIDALWDIFAAGGLVNPLDVIEQVTYFMFIHDFFPSPSYLHFIFPLSYIICFDWLFFFWYFYSCLFTLFNTF